MGYELSVLLNKMGVPQFLENKAIRWHYIDEKDHDIGGFADVRLEASDKILTAELNHWCKDYEDDSGKVHDKYTISFSLKARRIGDSSQFEVLSLSYEGQEFDTDDEAMIELGLSVFHSRAVTINTLMIEQKFKSLEKEMKPNSFRPNLKRNKKMNISSQFLGTTVVPFPIKKSNRRDRGRFCER